MSNNLHWTPEQMKKMGLVEKDGVYVPVSSLTPKGSVEKLPNLLERSVTQNQLLKANQNKPWPKIFGETTIMKQAENRKVKNATKSTNADGVSFDSNLERYMYDLLTGAKVHFEFQKKYTLQQGFKYRDETIRPITLTVDFFLGTRHIICDTKGMQTQQGAMRWKMLKSYLKHIQDDMPEIVMPANKTECEAFVNRLLYQK